MEDAQVHVIGGGLGGLAAAAFVTRSGHSVVVHEQRGRLGGRATTDERRGYRFNQGPHALYLGGEAAAILRELTVPTPGSTPPTNGSRMVLGGNLHLAPGGVGSLLRTTIIGVREKVELASLMARLPRLVPSGVDVNGQRGAYVVRDGEPYLLTVLSWRDRRVAEAIAIVNPDKLRHFHESWSVAAQPSGPAA